MSKLTKCDVCGKIFEYGFIVDVNIQGGQDYTNIAKDWFEIGKKDVCYDCYYKAKKMLKDMQ